MATPGRSCSVSGCSLKVPEALAGQGLCLNHYLHVGFEKLDQAVDDSRRGDSVDVEILDWLVAQVDCIVEIVGAQSPVLDSEEHSRLLELLLGIANLNEHVRRRPLVARRQN